MDYYSEIKQKIIDNEIYEKVKDYSKVRNTVITYFEIGRLLAEAGKHYGESIIKKYSEKLSYDIGKKYSERSLRSMRQFYILFKDEIWKPSVAKLTWSHFLTLMVLKDKDEMYYYINQISNYNLSKRQLIEKIKNNEYKRLDNKTKEKLRTEEELKIQDFIKNPILVKNSYNYNEISEKVLKKLILEDIDSFLDELGIGFSYIKNEYKIKMGDRYNYIDLLLYNIEFNCYTVVELKVTELKKEHIGQIETYMNYIDKNIKRVDQDRTIGIIICKKENKFIMEYCSDDRILTREYNFI